MAIIKTDAQIELMKESGRIVAKTLRLVSEQIRPGISPLELDTMAEKLIREEGGTPSFLGYRGYPNATCIAVNEVVVHGIPSPEPLKEGDIITAGQVIGLIEAMKVYSEIHASTSGVVKKLVAENGAILNPGDVILYIG